MKQFYLAEIVTKDKLIHQGIFFRPKKPTKKAILWVHGLTSTFYGNVKIFDAFAEACEKERCGFVMFNNRGHDMITDIRKVNTRTPKGFDYVMGGAGYEEFKDCIYDIDAGISFLNNQGFSEIILAGHSTGANKVCYYAGIKHDSRVVGVILVGPLSDRLGKDIDKRKLRRDLQTMQKLVDEGRGDDLVLGYHFFPMTPRRFLSIFSTHSAEDVFNYGDKKSTLTVFSHIKKPLLIIIGEKDENLDRSVGGVLSVYKEHTMSTHFASTIIPGAHHSFNGKEEEVVGTIFRWVREL